MRFKSYTKAAVISAVMIGLAAPAVSAQVPAPAPTVPTAPTAAQAAFLGTSFATVVNGREVWITTANGSRLKVRVAAVAATGLTVTGTDGQGQTVRFEDITRIQKVSHRLRTGTLVGLGVGGGLGLLGAGLGCDDGECLAGFSLTYAGIGAGIGALAGAIRNYANRDDDLIFDGALRSTTTVSLIPIVSRTRKGAAVSITWR